MKPFVLLACALSLTACGKADNEPGPGGVTVGEARALDEAAQMLDERRPPAEIYAPTREDWPEQATPSDNATP